MGNILLARLAAARRGSNMARVHSSRLLPLGASTESELQC